MPQPETVTLKAVFSEVLADLAFLFTDEVSADACPDPMWLESTIRYRQAAGAPIGGILTLRCPAGFGRLLAANLLGLDPGDEEADVGAEDAVGEFMNIVCGQLITAMHGTQTAFNLTIPATHVLAGAPDLSDGEEDPAVSRLAVEGYPILLTFTPQDGAGEN